MNTTAIRSVDVFKAGDSEVYRYYRLSRLSDGRKNRLLFVNPCVPGTQERRNLTVRLSYDEGRTWPVSKTAEPGFGGYSDLSVLPDGTILCLYEGGDPDGRGYSRLVVARFGLEWLTDGMDSLPGRRARPRPGSLAPRQTTCS